MRYYATLLAALIALTACHKNGSDPFPTPSPVDTIAQRTLIVYMAAENNLSYYALADIDEMRRGVRKISQRDNLIVIADRTGENDKPCILRLNKTASNPVDTVRKYQKEFLTSDPDKMQETIAWVMSRYPAVSYGLVLWGHADGWIIHDTDSAGVIRAPRKAYGVDNGENRGSIEGKWMNIPSLRKALQALPNHFKFILADCCNMQCAEVAYELKDVCEYFIAAPSEITGDGAPYETIVPDLFITDDTEMYTKTCDDYHAQTDPVGGHLPIATVRTANMPMLASATRDVLQSFWKNDAINTDTLVYYYHFDATDPDTHIMYDMRHVIRQMADAASYNAWYDIFRQTVVYRLMSSKWHANYVNFSYFSVTADNFGGMSMFVPLERYNTTAKKYNELAKQTAWYHAVGWPELLDSNH